MWYAIQVKAGREEDFKNMVQLRFDKEICEECMLIKAERLKRLGGVWAVRTETLFPGYVFIKTSFPKKLEQYLHVANAGTILSGERNEFLALEKDEADLFASVVRFDNEYIIELTDIEISENGEILSLKGKLENFKHLIKKISLRKRYAIVNIPISGREKTVLFGLCLKKDRMEQEQKDGNRKNNKDEVGVCRRKQA